MIELAYKLDYTQKSVMQNEFLRNLDDITANYDINVNIKIRCFFL